MMEIILAGVVSLAITLAAGKLLIPALIRLKAGQSIKEVGPTWHKGKQGTPTMGGLMFIIGIGIAILANGNPLGCIFASILFGFLNVMGTTMGRLPGLNIPASIIELIEGIVMICVIISYAVRYAMDVKKKKAMMRKAGV